MITGHLGYEPYLLELKLNNNNAFFTIKRYCRSMDECIAYYHLCFEMDAFKNSQLEELNIKLDIT